MRKKYVHIGDFNKLTAKIDQLKFEKDYWKDKCKDLESENKDLKFKVHKLETSLKGGKDLIEYYRHNPQIPVCSQLMLKDCENNFPFVKNWCGNVSEVVNEPGNRSIVITTVEKVDDKWTCHRFVYNFDNKTIAIDKD